MRRRESVARKSLPSLWAILFLAMCCGASLFITLRATAQNTPSKAEESATIHDDATIAPDAAESADNNISFPVDT